MVSSLSNILPINIVGTVSGTVASGTPTTIFSRANVQNVVIVTENPIPVSLVGEVGIGSRVKSTKTSDQAYTRANTPTLIEFSDSDNFDTDGWHDPAGADPEIFTVPAGKDGLYLIASSAFISFGVTGIDAHNIEIFVDGTIVAGGGAYFSSTNLAATDEVAMNVVDIIDLVAGQEITVGIQVADTTVTGQTDTIRSATISIVRLGSTV